MRNIFAVYILFTLSLFSCSCHFLDSDNQDSEPLTPYASESELNSIQLNDSAVSWKTARFFAVLSMEDLSAENSWSGAELSKYPIIIYNHETETPRYYEFRVILNGKENGAITCSALKEEGEPVQFILEDVPVLQTECCRSVQSGTYKITDNGYPGHYTAKKEGSNRSVNAADGSESEIYPRNARLAELLNEADEETLSSVGFGNEEIISMYRENIAAQEERIANLWKEIEKSEEKIQSLSDEEIKAFARKSARNAAQEENVFILDDWFSKRSWFNPGGSCGANAVSFIALGLGKRTSYSNMPDSPTQYRKIYNMYQDFVNVIGNGAKLFCHLNDGLKNKTGFGLKADWFHSWENVDRNLRENKLPCVSLRGSKFFDDWQWHYRVIIGTKEIVRERNNKFLWATWTSYESERWYLMHDNGSDGNNFWEKADRYYHINTAHVEK